MAIKTVGSAQALLQLISIYNRKHGKPPTVGELWVPIGRFLASSENHGPFSSYKRSEGRGKNTLLSDITELLEGELIQLQEGRLAITPMGSVLTGARELPEEIARLENEV